MEPMRVLRAAALAIAILSSPAAVRAGDGKDPAAPAGPPTPPPPPSGGLRRSKAFNDTVNHAIDQGVQWLRGLQRPDGAFRFLAIPMVYGSGEGSLGPSALA